MAIYNNKSAFDATVEITKSAISSSQSFYPDETRAETTVAFMQAVYDKLAELHETACQPKHTD